MMPLDVLQIPPNEWKHTGSVTIYVSSILLSVCSFIDYLFRSVPTCWVDVDGGVSEGRQGRGHNHLGLLHDTGLGVVEGDVIQRTSPVLPVPSPSLQFGAFVCGAGVRCCGGRACGGSWWEGSRLGRSAECRSSLVTWSWSWPRQ